MIAYTVNNTTFYFESLGHAAEVSKLTGFSTIMNDYITAAKMIVKESEK